MSEAITATGTAGIPHRPRIYLSAPVADNLNPRRAALKRGILKRITDAGCEVQEFGVSGLPKRARSGWSFAAAADVMARCDGALILALARTFCSQIDFVRYWDRLEKLTPNQRQALMEMVISGIKPRAARAGGVPLGTLEKWLAMGSPFRTTYDDVRQAEAKEAERFGPRVISHPSPFNHLEGGLAIMHKLPLLIFAEEGMDVAGILHEGPEHFIHKIPMEANAKWLRSDDFGAPFDAWIEDLRARRDVFLGYCSRANEAAHAIRDHLEARGYSVVDWQRPGDFRTAGATILEEIHRAVGRCRCAVFLFTEDDPLEGKANPEFVPRDNVVLEAGSFIQARGKERVAIIRETGAKMPADLGGIIYLSLDDRQRLATINDRLVQFLRDAL